MTLYAKQYIFTLDYIIYIRIKISVRYISGNVLYNLSKNYTILFSVVSRNKDNLYPPRHSYEEKL